MVADNTLGRDQEYLYELHELIPEFQLQYTRFAATPDSKK